MMSGVIYSNDDNHYLDHIIDLCKHYSLVAVIVRIS